MILTIGLQQSNKILIINLFLQIYLNIQLILSRLDLGNGWMIAITYLNFLLLYGWIIGYKINRTSYSEWLK